MSDEIKDMLQAILGRLDEHGTILKAVRGRLEEQGAEIKGIHERMDRMEGRITGMGGELKAIRTTMATKEDIRLIAQALGEQDKEDHHV